jgi:hypothetical protein
MQAGDALRPRLIESSLQVFEPVQVAQKSHVQQQTHDTDRGRRPQDGGISPKAAFIVAVSSHNCSTSIISTKASIP